MRKKEKIIIIAFAVIVIVVLIIAILFLGGILKGGTQGPQITGTGSLAFELSGCRDIDDSAEWSRSLGEGNNAYLQINVEGDPVDIFLRNDAGMTLKSWNGVMNLDETYNSSTVYEYHLYIYTSTLGMVSCPAIQSTVSIFWEVTI